MVWPIWPQKSPNLVYWGRNYSHFSFPDYWKCFRPGFFKVFFAIFNLIVKARTLLVIMVCIYTCESMILATKIIKIGWLGQKSQPFFISRLLEKYLPRVFHTFCYWHPYKQCQSTSRHYGMHIRMRKHDFSLKNHQNWSISGEIMANFQIVNISSSLDLKIGHYICPNGPILMIFVAKIMLSHV